SVARCRSTTPTYSAISSAAARRTSSSTCSTCSANSAATCWSRSATSARSVASSKACAPSTRAFPGRPARCLSARRTPNSGAFSRGLSFLTGYTWSRSIDNASAIRSHNGDTLFPQNSYNLAAEKALSSFHTAHRFVGSATYEFPFGNGKRFLDRGGIVNALLGGWQVSPIVTIQTGFPLTVVSGVDRSNIGAGFDRPNQVAGTNSVLDGDQRTLDRWFNTDAFVLQPAGTFGNVRRNTIIGPGFILVDTALMKNIRFTE